MAVIQILQIVANENNTAKDAIRSATAALKKTHAPRPAIIGVDVANPNNVQILSELDNTQNSSTLPSNIQTKPGQPQASFHVELTKSPFDNGLASAPVIEFVESWFPVSRISSDFQQQIESDFARFESIYKKRVGGGDLGWISGWTVETEDHEGIKDEKARAFFIMRGWESMEDFQEAVQTDHFKEASPILFGWNAPFKMWHVARTES